MEASPEEVFADILGRYPDTIDLSDSKLASGKGASVPALAEAYDRVDAAVVNVSWVHEAMSWSLYQHLHSQARICIESGVKVLDTSSTHFLDVKHRYEENLSEIKAQRNNVPTDRDA